MRRIRVRFAVAAVLAAGAVVSCGTDDPGSSGSNLRGVSDGGGNGGAAGGHTGSEAGGHTGSEAGGHTGSEAGGHAEAGLGGHAGDAGVVVADAGPDASGPNPRNPDSGVDAGAPPLPAGTVLLRAANFSPGSPALRVCLRPPGATTYSLELTQSPDLAARCGNGFQEPGEECDGRPSDCDALGSRGSPSRCDALCASATSNARPWGTVSCTSDCKLDTTSCRAQMCGDGLLEGTEACDGVALAANCSSVTSGTRPSGTPTCMPTCELDTSACTVPDVGSSCGNGTAEGQELCDGSDLRNATCLGVTGTLTGTLACTASCLFDVSGCHPNVCGDGVASGTEECDGSDVHLSDCYTLTFGTRPNGKPACTAGCKMDPSPCNTGASSGGGLGSSDAGTVACPWTKDWPPLPGKPRTVADGLDYTEVTTYAGVPGGAVGVKLVLASGSCDDPGLLEATVDVVADAATLLVTGRSDPDAGASGGSLRVRALPDHWGLVVRSVDTVETAPELDEWLTATGGPYEGRSVRSVPGLTYANSTAPVSPTVVVDGYGSTSGLSLDWFSASLIEAGTNDYLGSWPLAIPSILNAVTLFIHGSLSGPSPEGMRVLQCDDLGRPVDGLVPCTELPFQCAPPDRDGGNW